MLPARGGICWSLAHSRGDIIAWLAVPESVIAVASPLLPRWRSPGGSEQVSPSHHLTSASTMPKKVKGKEKRKNKFDRGLLSLPREIILLVRAQMHSLEAHVAFSLACRATKSLYDDKFWRSALITSGWSLSRLSDETKQALKDDPKIQIWAGLARIIDEDARSCDNEDWRINMWAEIPEEADCVLHTTKDSQLSGRLLVPTLQSS